ncbi:hypothetical protein ASPZODRAFT_135622, partial [Penicilliopsis zonata CBS 506.65]
MSTPPSILNALSLPESTISTLSTSLSGFTTTGRLTVQKGEEGRIYFVKISDGRVAQEMFRGEFTSLNAIADAVPGFCPRGVAYDSLDASSKKWFLITEFLDLTGSKGARDTKNGLASRLGRLHSTPAPRINEQRMFGFPVPTFCGDTKQANMARESWAQFYAEDRLLGILAISERRNGRDTSLREMVERTAEKVVPALLRAGHLGFDSKGAGQEITPVVVHGDLWSGNAGYGRIITRGEADEGNTDERRESDGGAVVYDPSACYAHSEYELGIMRMFGGFEPAFVDEYHRIVPRTEPVDEYEDRIALYEL